MSLEKYGQIPQVAISLAFDLCHNIQRKLMIWPYSQGQSVVRLQFIIYYRWLGLDMGM